MKIKPYVDNLISSKKYTEFKQKYPKAFMVAGFFILDLEGGQNIHQIDYYIPSEKKVAAFTLDKGVDLQVLKMPGGKKPEELDLNTNIDLDALSGIIHDEMRNRNISEDIKKIIAVVQTVKGKKIWNINCILTGMEILRAHVEDSSGTVLKMERISMMDIMKKMPGQMQAQPQPQAQPQVDMQPQPQIQGPQTKEEVEDQLQKLDKIEEEIEKEKELLKKKLKEEKEEKEEK